MIKDLLQPSHLIIVLVLLVILFGWKRLPDAARSVGRSMRIFKSEVSEMKNDGKDSSPSPAASDTVRGDVVPPASTTSTPTTSAPSTAPSPATNGAAATAAAATPPTENRTAPRPADATVKEPEHQQNPAL